MSGSTRHTGGERASGPARPVRIAFFDVDETLIGVKSMFSFLEFHLADPDRYRAAAGTLTRAARSGVPREETNRAYYRNFAGMERAAVVESGRRWFSGERRRAGFFHREAVGELRRLQAEGYRIALVSGSFRACLDPIAEHLGADHVLCSEPEVVAGRYTGEVLSTVIGEGKATAARALMDRSGARPEECAAYGDHASDLPLLTCVGRAGVVGDDPVLAGHARRLGWIRLPQAAGPEAAGLEVAKPATAGSEAVGPGAVGSEAAGSEAFGPGAVGPGAVGLGAAGSEAAKPAAAGSEAVGLGASGSEAAKPAAAGSEAFGPGAVGPGAVGLGAAGSEAAKPAAAGSEAVGLGAAGSEAAKPAAAGSEAAGPETDGPEAAEPAAAGFTAAGRRAAAADPEPWPARLTGSARPARSVHSAGSVSPAGAPSAPSTSSTEELTDATR
ncbi:HAD-IB family hydrolase [Streptomyces sp. JNUCC 63]